MLDLESTVIKVNAACPGFTATDLNNLQGTRPVQQAAREPVCLAVLDANDPNGRPTIPPAPTIVESRGLTTRAHRAYALS
jgi:hypothetical protein